MRKKYLVLFVFFVFLKGIIAVHSHAGGDDFTSDSDIGLLEVFVIALLSGWVPLMIGVMSYFILKDLRDWSGEDHKWTDGVAMGVMLFLIYDYLSLSGNLGLQNFKVGNNSANFLIIFLMLSIVAIVFLGFAYFDDVEKNDYTLYTLWALGLGFHSFSEGIIMGFNLQQGLAPALRFFPILSFLIHKFMEGFTLMAIIIRRKEVKVPFAFLLTIIGGITILPGVYFGYAVGGAYGKFISYFYAAAYASVMFIIPKFFPKNSESNMMRYYVAFGLGFIILYFGSLIHEI